MAEKIKNVENAVVYNIPADGPFGYFGWPTVALLNDGTLCVGTSGFREGHICPFGKSVMFYSKDNGATWSYPEIVNDGPIDDRDVGLTALPNNELLLTWFTSDTRWHIVRENWYPCMGTWKNDVLRSHHYSYIRKRNADGTWGCPAKIAVSAPHGPVLLPDGSLIYLGNEWLLNDVPKEDIPEGYDEAPFVKDGPCGDLVVIGSKDNGETWSEIGRLPKCDDEGKLYYCEPHLIALKDGRLLAMLRTGGGEHGLFLSKSFSDDGGKTWTKPEFVTLGGPPHLMRHSSGVLICTYGYRLPGYGQRVIFSKDEGQTWSEEWIIRDDGNDGDLGYPSTVELPDGSLFTVYYQALPGQTKTGILSSKWSLPQI